MLARVKLKGTDGGPAPAVEHVVKSMVHEEPYQGLTCA